MITEKVTNGIAVGAVVSPWWLTFLSDVSDGATRVLPILGAVWLVVQITTKLHEWWTRKT